MTENTRYETALKYAIIATTISFGIEVAGSMFSGSLSLLSDAGHMLRDVLALMLSFGAITVAHRLPTKTKTFGYHRVEILVALFNGIFLIFLGAWILWEAVIRFAHPISVNSQIMLPVAIVGLIVNVAVALTLLGSQDVNIRSAFVHVLGDTVASVGVIAAAIWITFTGQVWVDPVLSAVIALVIIASSVSILRETIGILLQFTPPGIHFDAVVKDIESVPGVSGVHNVHLWSLCSNINILDAHIYSCDPDVVNLEQIKQEIRHRLEKYMIRYSVLEFECEECPGCTIVKELRD